MSEVKTTEKHSKWALPIILISVVVLWLGFGLFPYLISNSIVTTDLLPLIPKGKGIEKFGQLGDAFGMVNSLFSALAFTAIAWSIYLQQKDAISQKEDFNRSIETMTASAKAQADTALAQLKAAEHAEKLTTIQTAMAKVDATDKIRKQSNQISKSMQKDHEAPPEEKTEQEYRALVWEKRYRDAVRELARLTGNYDKDEHGDTF